MIVCITCISKTDGNEADTFMICQTTGKMFLKRPLDFESDASLVYYVTVTAADDRFKPLKLLFTSQ